MSWLVFAGVFLVSLVYDVIATLCWIATERRQSLAAALLSGLLILLVSLTTILYVANRWYVVPECLGAIVGTYLVVRFSPNLNKG